MPPETRFGNDKATMQKLQTLSDGKFNETKGVWSLGCPTNGWGSWIRTNERTGLDGVKVRCLTAWRYPNMIKVSSESTLRKMTEFACHDLKCTNACFSELVTRKKAPRAFCRDSCCSATELGLWRLMSCPSIVFVGSDSGGCAGRYQVTMGLVRAGFISGQVDTSAYSEKRSQTKSRNNPLQTTLLFL